ncbi:MAG: hypothetical protein KatS3mg055_2582 [Chloroflexus sp.]|nr:MAG: hypothetical protein KatS3mg055_2582 [Chloroflexus sp.]
MPCPYGWGDGIAVPRRVVLWVFGHGMPCPYGWGDGVPWADGWCCGGLGTAAPCGRSGLGDGIVGARQRRAPTGGGRHRRAPTGVWVFGHGAPWADCVLGDGIWARQRRAPTAWGDGMCRAPTGGVVGVWARQRRGPTGGGRCAVRRRVVLWGFGHGSALPGWGVCRPTGGVVGVWARQRRGPTGGGTVCRGPTGGVVGGLGTAAPWADGWGGRCAVGRRVVLWGFGHGSAVGRRVGDGVVRRGWCCGGLGTAAPWADGWRWGGWARQRRAPTGGGTVCRGPTGGVVGVWARQRRGPTGGVVGVWARHRRAPTGGGTACRAPTGGVVGVWARHAVRRRRGGTALSCADGWCCGGLGTAAPCPYGWGEVAVGRRVVLWGFGHGSAVPLRVGGRCAVGRRVVLWGFGHGSAVGRRVVLWGFGHGRPWADGWCCGGLGTAAPWADGWCCGGLGTAGPWAVLCLGDGIVGARHAVPLRVGPSAPLRPLRLCVNVLCVNVLCVKRCAVGRRVVLWGFGHGRAVGRFVSGGRHCRGTAAPCPYGWGDGIVVRRRVVLWGFGHGSAVGRRVGPSAPLRPLRLCVNVLCVKRQRRAPTGGVKGIWARQRRAAFCVWGTALSGHGMPCPYGWGDGVPWADGWCCGGLGTAAPCAYGWR